ncbi:DUF5333 family protein [Celeribacter ethanolicus]|uniref:DUF5333 domain-containing protein n=1 Tax=Celeribacter ethanolicus TaxID=1758178 RepID=A0A291GBI1_9RHOB|nr:DUF5333 family protein [Celeribacter ethanolicus]ATG47424.1 hypothetical protein CEW89_07490 [Celeribacter ethanolicus]TNE62999.1 MAG: hypothetical protein EP336_18810 [Paracoccaceae bacterium]
MIRGLAYPAVLALWAVPALAQMAITEDPDIRGPLVDNMIVTELTTICPKLAARPARVNAQAKTMMETIVAKGYGADDIQTLQDPAFLAVLADESTSFFAAQGIEKRDTEAMCAFGKAQIAKRTPLGKLMKNR